MTSEKPHYRYITAGRHVPLDTLRAVERESYSIVGGKHLPTIYHYRSLTGKECIAVRNGRHVLFLQCLPPRRT